MLSNWLESMLSNWLESKDCSESYSKYEYIVIMFQDLSATVEYANMELNSLPNISEAPS